MVACQYTVRQLYSQVGIATHIARFIRRLGSSINGFSFTVRFSALNNFVLLLKRFVAKALNLTDRSMKLI